MAKAKTQAANLPVPQNDGEAERLIAQLGALQTDHAEDEGQYKIAVGMHADRIAALKEAFGVRERVFEEAERVIVDALKIWAAANRARLTGGGKTQSVQLPTGKVSWREGRYSVKHRGLTIEAVARAVAQRIEAVEAAVVEARKRRERDRAAELEAEAIVLHRFLRMKFELDKNAMIAARELAETIPGVTVPRGPEEFSVEPLASQIREVA